MIALDRDLPLSCFNCPCLETLRLSLPEEKKMQLFRICKARSRQDIIKSIIYSKGDELPQDWMNFPIPEWCPWKEI